MTRWLSVFGLIAIILAVLCSWWAPRRVLQPVAALDAVTKRLSDGDLAVRAPSDRTDELGRLGQRFNTMAATIEQRTAALATELTHAQIARAEAEAATVQAEGHLATIAQQQSVIQRLSVPVLPITDTTLVLPLIGTLDTERFAVVQQRALEALEQQRATWLLLDVTGVPTMDTEVAAGLVRVAQAVRLLGSRVIIVGMTPGVAQALVAVGSDLAGIQTQTSLQQGLAAITYHEARTNGAGMKRRS